LYTPDETYMLSEVIDSANIATERSATSRPWFSPYGSSVQSIEDLISAAEYAPFLNISVFLLMMWFYSLSNIKSHAELDHLVNDVILNPNFSKDDFVGFSVAKEAKRMDDHRRQVNTSSESSPVILALMIWSDSTHLASFGTASLWPIYLYFGNQSKYTRAKPSAFAAHHLAYIPKVWISHGS